MKKAQTQQVFIYMMVIVVVGALLIIGVRSIINIMGSGCEVELSRFQTQLQNDFQRNNRFGFVQILSLRAPCDYSEICFGGTNNANPVINASMAANAENIFLKRGNNVEPLLIMESLNPVQGPELCVNVSARRFEFRIEGVSRGQVNVSAAP